MKKRIQSFKYAGKGIWSVALSEANFRIHMAAAACVGALGYYLVLSRDEWIYVLFCVGMVMSAEAFNSAIETLVDHVSPDFHALAGKTKDIAAGAVLITAVCAAAVGCLIFLPKILALFR